MEYIPDSSLIAILYTGIKRFFWIFAIGWIVYASCTETDKSMYQMTMAITWWFMFFLGGIIVDIVSRFLSAKIFQPFSRLTFSIYLTQSLVVWYYSYQSRELHTISHYNSVNWFFSIFFLSWIISFAFCLLVSIADFSNRWTYTVFIDIRLHSLCTVWSTIG